ncbi:MAG: glycosyltransferase family 39 protein [Planctomycetes bacterium]|nr:glycosyltransferase family 39 protein [Planctomycetota bacterium]
MLLAVALRMPGYQESVWIDELYTSDEFCGDPVILLKTLYSDIHPPLYFVFIHFWNAVFGDSEPWLRLPPLLCGLLSIVLVRSLGDTLAGGGAGTMAAFLMAVSPVHIWYSQEARPYSANVCLLLVTLVAYYRLMGGPKRFGWAVLFAFGLFGVVFTHYYMVVFPFLLAGLALLRPNENRRRIVAICVSVAILLAVYMAVKMYFSHVPTSKGYLRGFDLVECAKLFFSWFLTGNSVVPVYGVPPFDGAALGIERGLQLCAGLVLLRGIWRLATVRRGQPAAELLLHTLALPLFLLALTLAGFQNTYIERSALPSLPLFLLVLATGLTGWARPAMQRAACVTAAVAATVVLTSFFLRGDAWTVYKVNPDWRGAAAWLRADLDAHTSEVPLVLYSDYISPTALGYYDARIQEAKKFERNDTKIQKLRDTTAKVFGKEGFIGAPLRAAIDRRLREYDAKLAALQSGTKMSVFELAVRQPFGEGDVPPRLWLLVYGKPSERAARLLGDARLRIGAQQAFRSLTLYRLDHVR